MRRKERGKRKKRERERRRGVHERAGEPMNIQKQQSRLVIQFIVVSTPLLTLKDTHTYKSSRMYLARLGINF